MIELLIDKIKGVLAAGKIKLCLLIETVKTDMPKYWPWYVTGAWFLVVLLILVFATKASDGYSINIIGDFLAGAFAPLAFLWLVVGYFQQNKALEQNREALIQNNEAIRLQYEELKNSVEQQKSLAESTRMEVEVSREFLQRQDDRELVESRPVFQCDWESRDSEYHLGRGFRVKIFSEKGVAENIVFEDYDCNDVTVKLSHIRTIGRAPMSFNIELGEGAGLGEIIKFPFSYSTTKEDGVSAMLYIDHGGHAETKLNDVRIEVSPQSSPD